MLKLRNLTESLEKKYLNESHVLNEKFSDNMPDWLAKRILTTKYSMEGDDLRTRDLGGSAHYPNNVGSGYTKRRDYLAIKGSKKSPNFGKEPDYMLTGGYGQSLFSGLRDMGIRLDTVEVIEGPVPKNGSDARVQSPNIPILLFDNGVVYIPGINDNEKLGGRKSLGAYGIDALLSRCKKFAYIDGSNPNNFFSDNERLNRLNQREGGIYRKNSYDLDRNGNPLGGRTGFGEIPDKSGYLPIPTMEKYKDKLDEVKAKKIYEIMKRYEDYLTDAQQEFANYISSLSMEEYRSNHSVIKVLQNRLKDAIDYYVTVDKYINEIVNDKSTTDEEKRNNLINLINSNYPYNWDGVQQLEREISGLKDVSNGVFNATIDWI